MRIFFQEFGFHSIHRRAIGVLLFLTLFVTAQSLGAEELKLDLVDIKSVDPSIVIELRYAGTHNPMHRPLYPPSMAALIRPSVAQQLARAQKFLRPYKYGLKIWDAYRPKSVQSQLWQFTHNDLYVANPESGVGSLHTWGVAVDATLADGRGSVGINAYRFRRIHASRDASLSKNGPCYQVSPEAFAKRDGSQRLLRSAHGMVAFHRSKLERLCLLWRYAGNRTITKERTTWEVMIDTLLRDLRQPEYVHVLLNPLPIYGLASGWIGLIISPFSTQPAARKSQRWLLSLLVPSRLGRSTNLASRLTTASSR
jgi:D-alanyl-D-alanine dipeptidase